MRFQLPFTIFFVAAAGIASSMVIPNVPESASTSSIGIAPAHGSSHLSEAEPGTVHLVRRTNHSPTDRSLSSREHQTLSNAHSSAANHLEVQLSAHREQLAAHEGVAAASKKLMDSQAARVLPAVHAQAKSDHEEANKQIALTKGKIESVNTEYNRNVHLMAAHSHAAGGDWESAKAEHDASKNLPPPVPVHRQLPTQ
ncbi:hypothetical protein FRC14_001058 [Serendipita sp. 396]|nr:hypothetical protein FRC14_001058 [Serendipita sp. 396]KAG8774787.1 hypothetical protein FRC15_001055 [Serendipita sp. 397]KAG8798280.1 hypothetical protein FRC16_007540 [Serendipita sp. 398]KAG8846103.1 hypothetical protein FRB91_001173 [Serendipita sp. 411]KAG8866819.1 hypothetical protein FRC20_007428 [Serendipita sp. 405]